MRRRFGAYKFLARLPISILYLALCWKNVYFVNEVLYSPRISRKSREGFEPSMAFRAMPDMPDELTVKILSLRRRNQCVAAAHAIDSK
jgi:hypothetical protein